MIRYKHWVQGLLVACALVSIPSTGHAVDSIWSAGVGKILPSDESVFCGYSVYSDNGLFTVAAKLQKRATDGTLLQDNYTDPATKIMIKMQCMNVNTQVVSPPITSGTFGDTALLQCPANGYGLYIRCQIRSTDTNPFVYGGGNMGGDPCGSGVSEITLPAGSNGFKGQMTGYTSELNFRWMVANKMFNQSLMTTAQVHGTDLGYMFYQGGKLWAGYGDTWANTWTIPEFPSGTRGSVLFSTNDLDPSDSNGLSYSSFVSNGTPTFAKEIVPSCHNAFPPCSEVTAIADAGFGLKEGTSAYRVLWFASISSWAPFTSKATLAWSVGTGSFKRADKDPIPGGTTPPVWSDASHFGAGGIYQDRLGGWIYLFGQRPYRDNTPVRLARVPAKFASVLDRTQYEYWSGSNWVKNAANPMAPSEGNYFGAAADIIPTSANVGPEFSVAFDAYANRYIMMLVHNRWAAGSAVELWQSANITGPWTKVTNGATNLPNANTAGGQWLPYNFFYGPYTSEHVMRNGGQNIYYQLSEWNGIFAARPYNVGLWTFNINRTLTTSCTP